MAAAPANRIIAAVDTTDLATARAWGGSLAPHVGMLKLGLAFFLGHGPAGVRAVTEAPVFLDLKLHDIPNTVAAAVRSAASLGAGLLTIHAAGGPAMMAAAQGAVSALSNAPQLLAVTVLTSMDRSQLIATGVEHTPADQVMLLAKAGLEAGIRGFVCSPQEVAALRALTGNDGVLVTPGIRPSGSDQGDQQRIATPSAALKEGASYLVVGRPITQAPDPAMAAEAILQEIAEALAIAPTE